jgi:ferrous iron transport protein B
MAVIVTRCLNLAERIIATLILALGIPCARRWVSFSASCKIGFMPLVLFFAFLTVQLIAAGWLASKLFPGETTAFVTELPPYRLPQVKNISSKTVYRSYWFIREVIPWFLAGTAFLFLADLTGALPELKRLLEPVVVGMLDLPAQTSEGFIWASCEGIRGGVFFDMYGKGL